MSEGLTFDFTEQLRHADRIVEDMRQKYSDENIENVIIPEIIASHEVGTVTVEQVLTRLNGMIGVLEPERFVPIIERMISADTGNERGDK